MGIKKRSFSLLLLVIFLASVSFGQSFQKIGEYSLQLDNQTGFEADFLQIFDNYIALGYRYDLAVNIYDFNSSKFIEKIEFKKEGANGVGNELGGIYFESLEKYIVHGYWENRIYEISKGKIISRIEIPRGIGYPSIETSAMSPMIKLGDELILTGNLENHLIVSPYKSFIEVNMRKATSKLSGVAPHDTYKNNYDFKNWAYYDYRNDTQEFVVSFAISDSLFIFDKQLRLKKKVSSNSKYIDSIEPIAEGHSKLHLSKDAILAYQISGSYLGVKYDPYRNLYYRLCEKSRNLHELYAGTFAQIVVMVLDSEFNVISEHELPLNDYHPNLVFVGKEGLYVANKKIYDTVNENQITFDIFRFE